jgi:hypothetical protein
LVIEFNMGWQECHPFFYARTANLSANAQILAATLQIYQIPEVKLHGENPLRTLKTRAV